ncbi:hypothetical protein C7M84_019056 [Penaeus vannamei]|uniref:CXXC-type domain-containing protein n=1 Tax=Penaeus vannamei TaxID=6689 RepID=A0A3R7LZC7_PENVA|nr:hypothetical protein C7M84_019056 [Penaeus vannamei]
MVLQPDSRVDLVSLCLPLYPLLSIFCVSFLPLLYHPSLSSRSPSSPSPLKMPNYLYQVAMPPHFAPARRGRRRPLVSCSVRVGMSSVPGPYNCLPETMELGEGLTGRLLDTHNLLFGDGYSDTLSSRIVGADGNSAYRPWEADHPADHRQPDHRLHPLAVSSAPIQVLTHTPAVPTASNQMSHYGHTMPTYSDSFGAGPPAHHVPPQHPVPHKLPPFAAFSPDRSVGSTTPSPLPSFNTLPSPHSRYPLVPAPVQAREIPTIQQQMMDERHIRMFESPQGSDPAPSSTTPAQASPNTQPPTGSGVRPRGREAGGSRGVPRELGKRRVRLGHGEQRPGVQRVLHRRQQLRCLQHPRRHGCLRLQKPVKKKRKRCGDCVGCQRKDNCGDCAPCRNDKSHQICKMRRCDKLTEKRSAQYGPSDYGSLPLFTTTQADV